ncbi:MAG: gamma-glutamyltransferase [Pseudomonadota bacterium]
MRRDIGDVMRHGALACGHAITADAVETILREKGNAADAAIAGAFAAMVAEPVLAGLLGGGFCMLAEGREARLLDFFVQTPREKRRDAELREIKADFGTTTQRFHIGAGSVATPGLVPGLFELHARAGRLPLTALAEPAIAAARAGVEVTPYQARLGQIVAPILAATEEARGLFCEGDQPLSAGAVRRNPDFADVLDVLTREGPRFATEGEIAAALLASTGAAGHLTAADLRRYRPVWRAPLRLARRGTEIAANPAPAMGGVLVSFALGCLDPAPGPSAIARALAATDAARLAANDLPEPLLDPAWRAAFLKQMADHPSSPRGTTHISVIDAEGRGAALTLSNGEGAGMIAPGTGIMPNNMLGEADLIPGAAEDDWLSWPVDTRLASMMCPMVCRGPAGELTLLGSGGSNRIRSALTHVLVNLIDRDLPLEEAIAAPRLHAEGAALDVETAGLAEADLPALRAGWPELTEWPEPSMFFGGVHAVRLGARGASAAGDARRAGVARIL